jgi:hypothetical protein
MCISGMQADGRARLRCEGKAKLWDLEALAGRFAFSTILLCPRCSC